MSRIIGPDFIALQVRDLEAAKQFYTEQLGLVLAPQSPPNAVLFQTEPIPFAIRTPLVDLDASQKLGWGVSLWLNCEKADSLCATLEAHGITITQQPNDGPFGRTFAFISPDGYLITVHGSKG